jgi:hypothetical protein
MSALKKDDYRILAFTFGFGDDWKTFMQFVIEQEDKHIDRQLRDRR